MGAGLFAAVVMKAQSNEISLAAMQEALAKKISLSNRIASPEIKTISGVDLAYWIMRGIYQTEELYIFKKFNNSMNVEVTNEKYGNDFFHHKE